MDGSGLQQSIWAPGRGGAESRSRAHSWDGDWNCATCGFSNYKWRTQCFRCHAPPSSSGSNGRGRACPRRQLGAPAPPAPKDSTSTPLCTKAAEPSSRPDPAVAGLGVGQGLSVSIWAPRHEDRRQDTPTCRTVWTRVLCSFSTPPSQSSIHPEPSLRAH